MKILSPRNCFTLVVLLALCATAAYGQRRRGAGTSSPPATLTGMKIIHYNGMNDTFSEDMSDSDQALFNDLDISLLVKVEVTGKAGEFSDRTVQITARQGRKLVLNKTAMVGIYNDSGKYTVTAWIYNPICQETVIEARLLGQRQPSVITKKVGANCGE